jgi:hypothetical protein
MACTDERNIACSARSLEASLKASITWIRGRLMIASVEQPASCAWVPGPVNRIRGCSKRKSQWHGSLASSMLYTKWSKLVIEGKGMDHRLMNKSCANMASFVPVLRLTLGYQTQESFKRGKKLCPFVTQGGRAIPMTKAQS